MQLRLRLLGRPAVIDCSQMFGTLIWCMYTMTFSQVISSETLDFTVSSFIGTQNVLYSESKNGNIDMDVRQMLAWTAVDLWYLRSSKFHERKLEGWVLLMTTNDLAMNTRLQETGSGFWPTVLIDFQSILWVRSLNKCYHYVIVIVIILAFEALCHYERILRICGHAFRRLLDKGDCFVMDMFVVTPLWVNGGDVLHFMVNSGRSMDGFWKIRFHWYAGFDNINVDSMRDEHPVLDTGVIAAYKSDSDRGFFDLLGRCNGRHQVLGSVSTSTWVCPDGFLGVCFVSKFYTMLMIRDDVLSITGVGGETTLSGLYSWHSC